MKRILFAFIAVAFFSACNAQNVKDKQQSVTIAESKPAVSSKVNKRYDEKGNLIGYDSTYSWSYSSNGQLNRFASDSLMNAMKRNIFIGNDFYDWQDSLFTRGNYFQQGMLPLDPRKMMLQMDSMMNSLINRRGKRLSTSKEV